MRILQILPELNIGGVEIGTVDLARELKKRGHRPYVVSAGGILVQELAKLGIPHFTLPVHRKNPSTTLTIAKLTDILIREKIDIIHARSRVPAWVAYFAAKRSNCDFVTTCHGYYSKHFFSRIMGWGKRVIVVSRVIGRRMIDEFGVPQDKIELIHRGTNFSKFKFMPEKYNVPRRKPYTIVNVGRITPIKGFTHFIRAINLATREINDLRVLIVGAPGKKHETYFADLNQMVRKFGLSDKIEFLGARQDVPEILQEADLLVMSSTIPESFSRVVVEAGASGTAVIATKHGGVLDIITDKVNGILVPPEDDKTMAEAIVKLLNNSEMCKNLASNLNDRVRKEFALKKMVDRTVEVYEKTRSQKKILVIKLGALGDIILAVPSFRMLKKRFPNARITLLVDKKLVGIVGNCPYVDDVETFDRKEKKESLKRFLKLVKRLRSHTFDISVDLQNNARTHLLAFLAGIPRRYGYKRGVFGRLLTSKVDLLKEAVSPVLHQFRVLRCLGITNCDQRLELIPKKEDNEYIEGIFSDAWINPKQNCVGLCLGSSKKWKTKRWGLRNFIALARKLSEKSGVRIIIVGAQEEKGLADKFVKECDFPVLNLVGKTNLSQLVSLISRIDVLVAGDSAPLHVACSVNTSAVVLFGPTDPKRHFNFGKDQKVIRKELPCSPCYQKKCSTLRCMKGISVDEVSEAVTEKLRKKDAAKRQEVTQ